MSKKKIPNLTGREGFVPDTIPVGIHGILPLPDDVTNVETFIRSKVARSRGEFVVGEIQYTTITIDGKKYVTFEVV